ncbi:MAG: CYTH domain-containing protein [Elusimicrobia bacterium]|nr:CYTH domain-containing protein [Elusimicrobiota bacterium]
MKCMNVEIKARCADPGVIRSILRGHKAEFKGTDRQTDTYFNVKTGRLKLRRGDIENALIYYVRRNKKGPKDSLVRIFKTADGRALRELLGAALDVVAEVKKKREIYYIGNVKFHIDKVPALGNFVEIEAIDKTGLIGRKKLLEQCRYYLKLFKIQNSELIHDSYSDMINRRARVTKNYVSAYPNPIKIARGDRLAVRKKETEWPGWVFCVNAKGIAGWVPESCVKIRARAAIAVKSYDAAELTVTAGEQIQILGEECGWRRVRNKEGKEGWIPKTHLNKSETAVKTQAAALRRLYTRIRGNK